MLKYTHSQLTQTPLNCYSYLPHRIGNNSLNATLIQQENLNRTKNLLQQDIQTPSHFKNEEAVITITTTQQSISPIYPNLTTPGPKNPTLPQVTLQSTVKPPLSQNIHIWTIKRLDQ